MTANTTRNAAGAADAIGQAERRGGTSVLLRDLTRAFGATRALDGLSIEMAPGELVALLGPSGCGKTTALRIVAGFETADTGSVLVDGKDISSVPAARRDMGMVFQSYSLFPNISALDNVAFGLRMRKIGAGDRRKRADDLLDMVGLAALAAATVAVAATRPDPACVPARPGRLISGDLPDRRARRARSPGCG